MRKPISSFTRVAEFFINTLLSLLARREPGFQNALAVPLNGRENR
jgi:hypothetical protein